MPANGQNPSKIPQSLWQSRSLEWGRKSYPSLTAVLLLLLLLLLLLQAGTYVVLSLPNLLRVGPVSASFHPCWDDFRKLPPVATSGYHANWRACEPEPWQTEVRTQETTVGLSPLTLAVTAWCSWILPSCRLPTAISSVICGKKQESVILFCLSN